MLYLEKENHYCMSMHVLGFQKVVLHVCCYENFIHQTQPQHDHFQNPQPPNTNICGHRLSQRFAWAAQSQRSRVMLFLRQIGGASEVSFPLESSLLIAIVAYKSQASQEQVTHVSRSIIVGIGRVAIVRSYCHTGPGVRRCFAGGSWMPLLHMSVHVKKYHCYATARLCCRSIWPGQTWLEVGLQIRWFLQERSHVQVYHFQFRHTSDFKHFMAWPSEWWSLTVRFLISISDSCRWIVWIHGLVACEWWRSMAAQPLTGNLFQGFGGFTPLGLMHLIAPCGARCKMSSYQILLVSLSTWIFVFRRSLPHKDILLGY